MFWERKKVVLAHILLFVLLLLVASGMLLFILRIPLGKKHLPRRFGATYMTMDNHYFEILNTAIEEIIESNGDKLITRDPAQNQKKQNEQIIDMLTMGVDLLFITPVDSEDITPALQECAKRHVPVIIVDTEVSQANLTISQIVSDNYRAGVLIAQDMMRRCNFANIVMLYDKTINSTRQRYCGFVDSLLASNWNYSMVYTSEDVTLLQETMLEMQSFLERKIPFTVVFGGNDPTALGALAAIQKAQLEKEVLIYGIDGSPAGKTMVQQGFMVGTVAQFPRYVGKKAAETAYDYLEGKPVEHDIVIPVELITTENLDNFDILGWQ